jgi:hypothetical protein
MAVRRYIADADTTITNAYKENLSTRATSSNMGASDSLEVFSIWGQTSGSAEGPSVEKSRALIKFPITSIVTDRANGDIPAEGSVNFYLKASNAEHPNTLPSDYTMNVLAVSESWSEGYGLDMETYKDSGAVNWLSGSVTATAATAKITALSKTAGQANTRVITVYDAERQSVSFTIDNSEATSTATKIAFANANSNATQFATNIAAAINAADTADTLNISASALAAVVTLTMNTSGPAGNFAADMAGTAVTDSVLTITNQFAGGAITGGTSTMIWGTAGGTYHTGSSNSTILYTASFADGDENLEVDITTLVEQWIAGTKSNYGIGLSMSGSSEDGTLSGSFYTKKFFGRGSEYFFKRPQIEARWDSSTKDDRTNFYASSSMVPGADNINTLYLYNSVRGQLKNIPGLHASNTLAVKFYRDSLTDNVPQEVTGGLTVDTGIYTASFAMNTTASNIYDVWSTGSTEYHTGSVISVKTFSATEENPNPTYVTSMVSLNSKYSRKETARFRLFVRKQNWSPTIYTKATQVLDSEVVDSTFYKIFRVSDNFEVVPYGTGSTNHTKLSYDQSGSYFDLNMNLFEADFAYGLNFAYYLNGKYVEQPETFKFRVEE